MRQLHSTPSATSNVVTINVVLDQLENFETLHRPDKTRRLSWCTVAGAGFGEQNDAFQENELLVVMHSNNLDASLSEYPLATGLLVLRHDEPFSIDSPNIARDRLARMAIVREPVGSMPFSTLLAKLQNIFFAMYQWSSTCRRIVDFGESLQDLIDTSYPIFRNWIDVNDATYSLLAYTAQVEPPDELSRSLVKNGSHSSEQIELAKNEGVIREWKEQEDIAVFEPDERVPFELATKILRIGDTYGGHVVMVCTERSLTPGLLDLFEFFGNCCQAIVERDNRKEKNELVAYQDFLLKLVEGVSLNPGYVANQKSIIGIEGTKYYCLASIDSAGGAYENQPEFLLSVVHATFPLSLAMNYDGSLLVMFYASDFDDKSIDNQFKLIEDFCERYECVGYISTAFKTIEHLHYAHEQTKMARKYRSSIEDGTPQSSTKRRRVFRFLDAFSYYSCDFTDQHDPFISFCLNNTPLDVITKLEHDRDVNDLKLLYAFLRNERRATQTAEQLHMHRNNVLYRVKSITQRYQLNLDDFDVRQSLLACFRAKINSSMSFRALLK